MGTLYNLTMEIESIMQDIMDAESGEEIAALTARLEEIEGDWMQKAGSYARVLKEFEAREEALDREAKRLTQRKKNCEAAQARLKMMMMGGMKALGLKAVDTDIGRWTIRQNAPSVEIIDAAKIPPEYLIQPAPTVSKTAILATYKADGEIVAGCNIVRKESLQFR